VSAEPSYLPVEPPAANPRGEKLSILMKAGYGAGQFVESAPGTLITTFFFYYVTNVCGLSGSLAGLAMFLALAVDAVADPVLGSVSDNLNTRWGRRIPMMVASLLPIAVASGLLFSIPSLRGWALFAYTLALLVGFRVSLSGFVIPFMGIGAEISDDYDERSVVAAFRVIFALAATLAVYMLGFGLFLSGPNGLNTRANYAPLGWAGAAVVVAGGGVALIGAFRALPRLFAGAPSEHTLLRRLVAEIAEVFRNPSFRMLFGGVLVFFVGMGVNQTLGLDGSKYFWGLSVDQIKAVALSTIGGLALGLPISFLLIGRIEKRTIVLGGIALVAGALAVPSLAEILGYIPPGAQLREHILMVTGGITGIVSTMVAIAFQSAMADAVDEHEGLFGARREGLYFASLSFASKAATGLGSLVSGVLLDAIGFPSQQIASGKAVAISHDVWWRLGLIVGPAAMLFLVGSLAFFWRYRLDRARHAAVRRRPAGQEAFP